MAVGPGVPVGSSGSSEDTLKVLEPSASSVDSSMVMVPSQASSRGNSRSNAMPRIQARCRVRKFMFITHVLQVRKALPILCNFAWTGGHGVHVSKLHA